MRRKLSPEQVKRFKELGAFDGGTNYLRVGGFSKEPKQTYWDEEGEDEDEEK